MEIPVIIYKPWLRCLILSAFLFGCLITTHTALADGPCSASHQHSGMISTDETWCTEGGIVHVLTDNVTVQAGATLTIAAGVTVDSIEGAWSKYLIVQGHLDIEGTLAQPVLLTRSINYPIQNWGGLYFDGSQGDGSGTINYASIDHAGANFLPPGCVGTCGTAQTAVFVKDLPAAKQLNISNSTIRDNTSKGLYVVDSAVDVFNTTFSQNKYPIWIEGSTSVVTYSGNTFSNNAYPYYDNTNYIVEEDSIFIGSNALMGEDFILPAQGGLDAYVFLSGTIIPSGTTMTVEPGVTAHMISDEYLTVQGHLAVIGTQALPVTFTGIPSSNPAVSLNWGGINFDGSAGDGSGDIHYANIENAGSNWPLGEIWSQYTVLVKDLPAGKQVNISNSFIGNSISKGLYVSNGKVNVTQTTFSHNTYPILIEGAASVVTYSGNTFSDNAYPYYDNLSYTVQEDSIFIEPDALMGHDFSLPVQTGLDAYVFFSGTTIPAGRTITVQPGVKLRTGSGSQFLTVQGQLNAIGTQALPVTFTGIPSSNPAVMLNWGGLIFDGPSGASGRLEHAIVEYGCGWWNSNCVTLMIYKLEANKSVVVEHSIVRNSANVNLAVIDSPTAQVDNNLIKGGQIGVYLASNMTVKNLAVIDQALDGVYVETGYSVDARHLTIARTSRNGFFVNTGGTGLLKNSILSHNVLAIKAEGSGQASLDTNLMDTNTTNQSGTVTDLHTFNGSAAFEVDGYHIQTTSAAVGVGLAGLSMVDIDGDVRPWPAGSQPDLGADEISIGKSLIFLPLLIR